MKNDQFLPLPPYNKYKHARLTDGRDGRQYIYFYGQGESYDFHIPGKTTYARYLFQVDLWKKEKKLIPEGYEVDHIDNDFTNDSLDNLQLLTGLENSQKRDRSKYEGIPVLNDTLDQIKTYLVMGSSWAYIADKLDITQGHLRYLLASHFPEYSFEKNAVVNLDQIEAFVKSGFTQMEIGFQFGVNQSTISRIIGEHRPHLIEYQASQRVLKLKKIGELLETTEMTLGEIGEEVGYTQTNVTRLIQDHFGDIWWKKQAEKKQRLKILTKQVRDRVKNGVSQTDIARELGEKPSVIQKVIATHMPQYNKNARVDNKIQSILAIYDADPTTKLQDYRDRTGCAISFIHKTLNTHRPDRKKLGDGREERIARIRAKFAKGLSQTAVAESEGVHQSSLSEFIAKHAPDLSKPKDL